MIDSIVTGTFIAAVGVLLLYWCASEIIEVYFRAKLQYQRDLMEEISNGD